MKKVYLFLADGCEEVEALTIVDLLRRAGIEIKTVSITGNLQITSSHQVQFMADELFDEACFTDADMLVLPGGMPGTTNLLSHKGLCDLLTNCNKQKTILAAICAAPSVFSQLGLLKGKKACCYPSFEPKLTDAVVGYDKVTSDNGVITGRGLGAAIEFSLTLIEKLLDKKTADHIAESIVYQREK